MEKQLLSFSWNPVIGQLGMFKADSGKVQAGYSEAFFLLRGTDHIFTLE